MAQKLGLSPTTVSRALNGYPEVSESTRARVTAAAKRHNYRPNARAIRLATGRAMAIGHVIPTASRHEIMNPVFADFIAGAGETYARNGYDLILTLVPDDDEDRIYRDLHARGAVDGIIVHGPRVNDHRLRLLDDIGFHYFFNVRASGTVTGYF
ncbi:MAG: LacI family DNA-binding transcriptional regulator, partial [Rhodobacterales bacterium]